MEVARFIRIQNREPVTEAKRRPRPEWRVVPNCEKLAVWDYLTMTAIDDGTGQEEKRFVFHVPFVQGVRKGSRVTYLGNHFTVLNVSDSKRLVGLELSCESESETP